MLHLACQQCELSFCMVVPMCRPLLCLVHLASASHTSAFVMQAYDTLKPLMAELLADNESAAAVRRALAPLFAGLGVPVNAGQNGSAGTPPPPRERVQQQLNSVQFLRGFRHVVELCQPLVPAALGETLVEHLTTWLQPSTVLASAPSPDGPDKPPVQPYLPASWRPGDERRAPAALLALFAQLPPAAVDLLQTAAPSAPGGAPRRGLVVLTIELEQV